MKEIARLAGVSIGTVDRVLHQRGRVSPENVAVINAIVAERGYKPNLFASRLSGGAVKTIAVVMPHAEQDFGYWKLLRDGMERAARELEPLHVEVSILGFDRNTPESCAAAFEAARGSQALALAPIHSTVLRPLVEGLDPLPLVFFDTDMECGHARCFVGQDPWQGGVTAATLLHMALPAGQALVLVRFDEDDEHLQKRSGGFEIQARTLGRDVLVVEQKLSSPLEARRHAVSGFLRAHAQAGGLFVPNASAGQYDALDRVLVGYDLIPENVKALREGRVRFLLSQRPEIMGYEAVRRLSRALLFHEPLPDRLGLPLDIILKENVDSHIG